MACNQRTKSPTCFWPMGSQQQFPSLFSHIWRRRGEKKKIHKGHTGDRDRKDGRKVMENDERKRPIALYQYGQKSPNQKTQEEGRTTKTQLLNGSKRFAR
ncbi:hypothetical protein HUJ04_011587 [Dendroctonus ponderosae]|nr:hypothetical protein HUJ04_011587 [Dendroctonus ponderosae]KAH1028728.1 hypothetical protein HUJ05_002058 [Dendroctonus ponderosae]